MQITKIHGKFQDIFEIVIDTNEEFWVGYYNVVVEAVFDETDRISYSFILLVEQEYQI